MMEGKYIILCRNEKEFINFQVFFYSTGGKWSNNKKRNFVNSDFSIEKNCFRVHDSHIVAMGSYDRYINDDYTHIDMNSYKFINFSAYIRKYKLKKLEMI